MAATGGGFNTADKVKEARGVFDAGKYKSFTVGRQRHAVNHGIDGEAQGFAGPAKLSKQLARSHVQLGHKPVSAGPRIEFGPVPAKDQREIAKTLAGKCSDF